jgi:hypothetical protein
MLAALAEGDGDKMRALAITEEEFRRAVWPSLPASRPERNLPFSYVWGELRQKSETSLGATLHNHRGRRYELRRVAFGSAAREYPEFRVFPDVRLVVSDGSGREHELQLCGSFLERNGQWKVFSFVVDD